MLNKCQISPNLLLFDSAFIFQSTAFLNGADFAGGGQYFMRSGGVFAKGGGGFSITGFTEMFITEATLFFADNDACCYGGPEWHIGVGGSFFFGGFVSTFKSVAKPFTASGHGMQILSGCTALFGLSSGSRFWGSGNAKKGVHVQAGGILAWGNGSPLNSLVPTVTGVAGDFAIGPLANVSSTTVDPAADPPVWLAKIANTWANLDTPAPIAAVAFGGNAIDALGGGRILKVGSTQIVTS